MPAGSARPISQKRARDGGPQGTWWFQRHPKLTLLGFSLTTIVVLDVLVGTVVHALGFDPASTGARSTYRTRHPVYHHGLRPSVRKVAFWGSHRYEVVTDNHGLKSFSTRATPLESQKYRILLIGDSFTEGVGYGHAETFAGLLDRRLGSEIEILNAGVVSYSPTTYNRKIQHLIGTVGLGVDEVLVMIDMSDIKDEATDYETAPDGTISHSSDGEFEHFFKRLINRHTLLLKSARTAARKMRLHRLRRSEKDPAGALGERRALWGSDDALWDEYGEVGLRRATARMDELRQFLAARGIPLRIGLYPWPDQIMLGDLEALQVRHWRSWAEENGVPLSNCFPDFIGSGAPEEVIRTYFVRGDVHWNAAGHALIAERLFQDLRHLRQRE